MKIQSTIKQSISQIVPSVREQSAMIYRVKIDKVWIERQYSDASFAADFRSGYPVEMIENGKTLRTNVHEVKPALQRKSNYDFKIGSTGYVNAAKYNLHYGKNTTRLNRLQENIPGSSLVSRIRELRIEGWRAFATSQDKNRADFANLKTYGLDQALGIIKQDAIPQDAPRSVDVQWFHRGAWTWFSMERAGVMITTDSAMFALMGEKVNWRGKSTEMFGKAIFAPKTGEYWACASTITPEKLAQFFDFYKVDGTITEIEDPDPVKAAKFAQPTTEIVASEVAPTIQPTIAQVKPDNSDIRQELAKMQQQMIVQQQAMMELMAKIAV